MGSAFNAPTPLKITQSGQPDLTFGAVYHTRPLEDSPYYQIQLGLAHRDGSGAWVFGFLHHKIYLENPPPEVQRFEVTYGYNIVYGGHGWYRGNWVLSAGAGVLLANPLTIVRGKTEDSRRTLFEGGLNLAGGSLYGSLQRRFPIDRFYFGLEGKVTASMAWISVAEGNAQVPNLAFHILGSIGVKLF